MKVVLFCGGFGLRLREHSEQVPKPMVPIGYRPVLWYIMKYYAYYGHTDFILCLGYKADIFKNYFLAYNEALSNDFVLEQGGATVTLLQSDIEDWRITFVDTGLKASIGERLKAVEHHLEGEDVFLANYADVLTDAPLDEIIKLTTDDETVVGSLLCAQPSYSFHALSVDQDSFITDIADVRRSGIWINGGYFVFRRQIFDYLQAGEDLVVEPFQRLIEKRAIKAYHHQGFWAPMDTLKEKQLLDTMYERGERPWCVWGGSV